MEPKFSPERPILFFFKFLFLFFFRNVIAPHSPAMDVASGSGKGASERNHSASGAALLVSP